MAMDRTNWKIGEKNINILAVGLLLPNGCFIPIIWKNLDKRGNSSEKERISLMERFVKVWQQQTELQITLLGDREFIGKKWFNFLGGLKWNFVIRARQGDYLSDVAKAINKINIKTQRHIARKVTKCGYFQAEIELEGQKVFYTVFRNTGQRKKNAKEDKYVILISNFSDVKAIREAYYLRWGIEVYFFHCKTNGFNLEDLNISNLDKAQLMMGLAAIAYVVSMLYGLQCQRAKKVKVYLKDYNGKKYRSVSLFRLGYDELKSTIHTLKDLIQLILEWLKPIPRNFKTTAKLILKSV